MRFKAGREGIRHFTLTKINYIFYKYPVKQTARIELVFLTWKAIVLPLNYVCLFMFNLKFFDCA